MLEPYEAPAPRSNLIHLGVDLDGTLAEPVWTPENPTSEIGKPLPNNVAKLKRAIQKGYKVIIHTSRPWTDLEAIEYWLNYHRIPFKGIQCGKPLYYRYIDDRGFHADENDSTEWV